MPTEITLLTLFQLFLLFSIVSDEKKKIAKQEEFI